MNFVELPPQTRHNFPLEALYETFMGLAQGLLLMAPVVAANALKANTIEMTAMVAATPVAALLMPFWTQAARAHRLQRLVIVSGLLRVVPLVAVSLVHSAAGFVALLLLDLFVAGPLLFGAEPLQIQLPGQPPCAADRLAAVCQQCGADPGDAGGELAD